MRSNKKKIMAICGSTRSRSLNLTLLNTIADLTAAEFDTELFTGIDKIPHFNPDLDNETPPERVVDFRRRLRDADAILICTPEYAMGVPGTLKNAIDWTVSSCEFSHKPVALITASAQGFKCHQSLLETLKIIESNITDDTQLLISYVKTKIDYISGIKDPSTLDDVLKLVKALGFL